MSESRSTERLKEMRMGTGGGIAPALAVVKVHTAQRSKSLASARSR